MIAYEVTLRPVGSDPSSLDGVAKMYVATEARAQEICTARPDLRSFRPLPIDEVPEAARAKLLSAIAA